MARKVYDYDKTRVRSRLVSALKQRRDGATVADLTAATGLPALQVQQGIREVAEEYDAHLRVTESGEILYHFPAGMRSRKRGPAAAFRRGAAAAARIAARVLTWLFKAWITVMLVGYFVLFVAIVVLAALASVAMSAAGRNDDRRGGGGGLSFYFAARMFELFLWLWFARGPRAERSRGRPLRQSVYAFVFGEPDPNAGREEAERAAVAQHLRTHRGLVTAEELMAMTGASPAEAQRRINRLMLELEGEPEVTDDGTIVYRFENIMRSRAEDLQAERAGRVPRRKLKPFNLNDKSRNGWITVFNLANAGFGTYFLTQAIAQPVATFDRLANGQRVLHVDSAFLYHFVNGLLATLGAQSPERLVLVALGLVPVAFSVFFFLVPALRRLRERAENEAARRENLRRLVYAHVMMDPMRVDPREIRPDGPEESPPRAGQEIERVLKELAAEYRGEPVQEEDGAFTWRFAELDRQRKDVEKARLATDTSRYDVGGTVFDSDR
jgi:hypothetical protein